MTPLVIGVGSPDRGDDRVGLEVVEQVRRSVPSCEVAVVSSPTRLIDTWDGHDDVIVVDAARTGRAAGDITVLPVDATALPERSGTAGTHGFGVVEAIELGRAVGRLPQRLVVIGVEVATFQHGAEMTPAVAAAVGRATGTVAALVTGDAGEGGDR